MSITRPGGLPGDHFTQISNAWVRDKRLSRRARGLLVELVSHSVGWEITVDSLIAGGPEGREAIRSTMKELEAAGYLKRVRLRAGQGRLAGTNYVITDPHTEMAVAPTSVEPTLAGPTLAEPPLKKNISQKTIEKKNTASSSSAQGRAQAPRPRRAQQQKVLMPQGWTPSEETVRWCHQARPDVDLQWTFEKYVAHRTENQQRSADWEADFKAWVMREHGDEDADVIDLRDRQSESTAKSGQGRAEWCGDCEEYDRTYEGDDGKIARCPVCHPAMAGAF